MPISKTTIAIFGAISVVAIIGAIFLLNGTSDGASDTNEQAAAVAVSSSNSEPSPYLEEEEVIRASSSTGENQVPVQKTGVRYIEIPNSCNHNWEGDCVVAYDQPSMSAATTSRLREGMVLRTDGIVTNENQQWFRLQFDDQPLNYPERVESDWFVSANDAEVLYKEGTLRSWVDEVPTSTNKRIVIDKSEQRLYAYEGEELFLETEVSTGVDLSPTTLGTFEVFKKMPSRYMQGPLEGVAGSDYYDLSGVPWNLYFTEAGAVIHGAYWHDSFGQQYSHGCVNLPPAVAQELYAWTPLTTTVTVVN